MADQEAIDAVLARLPEELRDYARKWAPVFLDWGVSATLGWVELVLRLGAGPGLVALFERMDDGELVGVARDAMLAGWEKLNVENRAAIRVQREAGMALARVLLAIAIAAVGL